MSLSPAILENAFNAVVEKGWNNVTLADIAKATDMSLADLRGHMSSKYDLVPALNRHVDAEVLNDVGDIDLNDSARDRLFEVMMARFDALQPYKTALGVMGVAARSDLHLAAQTQKHIRRSMGWMLEAAGLATGGIQGAFRQNGLAVVYVRSSLAWLKDDSEDLSATMKALDKALGDAERWANTFERSGNSVGGGFDRMKESMSNLKERAQSMRSGMGGGQRYRSNDDGPVLDGDAERI